MDRAFSLPYMSLTFLLAFSIVVLVCPVMIPVLHKLKFGQEIREEGPKWHQKKSGTPTMGGIVFIGAVIIATVMYWNNLKVLIMLFTAVGFGVIGFIDDYIKVIKKRNLGLKAGEKFFLQAALAIVYVVLSDMLGLMDCSVIIPFTHTAFAMPGYIYIPFTVFVILAVVNSVNLTDGIDGLATSVTIMVTVFFACVAWLMKNAEVFPFALAVIGGCMGFLLFNKHPAKVFMGDTGSLFLGGAVVVMAINMKMHLLILIVGFVYLAETLSVIIQVASFKLTGKRVFKMSPIHHHFEMIGWSEKKIVTVFTVTTILLGILATYSVWGFVSL